MPAHEHGPKTQEPPVRRIAAPLVVGAADDRAEIEADLVADRVIARLQSGDTGEVEAPEQHVHNGCHGVARQAAPPAGGPEVGFEGGALSDDLSSRIEGARSGGQPLDGAVRRRLEPAFGGSLSDVRVHTGGESAALNRAVSARAFTTGKDIFFGAGEYSPDTATGERVLAHEIAHTRQPGSGPQRLHRMWDFKAQTLATDQATDISTLTTRPIWFVKDSDEDTIVVKAEDQPVGLGMMAAKLHKKVSGIKSVKTRRMSPSERNDIRTLMDVKAVSSELDRTWTARGDHLKQVDDTLDQTEFSGDLAVRDAQKYLYDPARTVVAMTVATGDGAEDLSAVDATKTTADDDYSKYRALMLDPGHLKQLGKVAAVDQFYGNQDRTVTGNIGNWFIDAQSADKELMLLDHVDPGAGPRMSTTKSFETFKSWKDGIGVAFASKAKRHRMVHAILVEMDNIDGNTFAWSKQPMPQGAGTRHDYMTEHLNAGFVETAQRIVKIFGTTKWSLGSMTTHKDKKSIRSAAKSGAQDDGQAANMYYKQLKDRATWIKKNLK